MSQVVIQASSTIQVAGSVTYTAETVLSQTTSLDLNSLVIHYVPNALGSTVYYQENIDTVT